MSDKDDDERLNIGHWPSTMQGHYIPVVQGPPMRNSSSPDLRTKRVRYAIAVCLILDIAPGNQNLGEVRRHIENMTRLVMKVLDDPNAPTLEASKKE